MKNFRQITMVCLGEHADLLEELLFLGEARAVTLVDEGHFPIFEPPVGQHPVWPKTRISAIFDDHRSDRDIIDSLANYCYKAKLAIELPKRLEMIGDQDWVQLSIGQFQPFRIGTFWVRPSWDDTPIPTGYVELKLHPGLAFGTGMHPTTQLCLEWISTHDLNQRSVIDFGCGSGILGIGAGVRGAHPVVCLDIDPQALIATESNANLNTLKVTTLMADQTPTERFDVVIANILSKPLIELAGVFAKLLKPGGSIVLAGLLDEQSDSVRKAYHDIIFQPNRTRDGWTCLSGIKPT